MRSEGLALLLIGVWVVLFPRASFGSWDEDSKPSLSVSGTGKISAAPDMASVSVGVVSEAATASDALRANSQSMAALQTAIRERGVAAKDMQTSNISVQPKYSQPAPGRPQGEFVSRIVGYSVTNTVEIRVRDLGKLGELLDAVVSAGANQVYGITFGIDKADALLDEARKRAVADARRKAELLAGEAGVVLGQALQISESGGMVPPTPMAFRGGGMMAMAAAEVPVSSGEIDLSVNIQIVYEIRPPQ